MPAVPSVRGNRPQSACGRFRQAANPARPEASSSQVEGSGIADGTPVVEAPGDVLTVQLSMPLLVVIAPDPAAAALKLMYPKLIGVPVAEKSGVPGPEPATRVKFDGDSPV